VLGFHPTMYSPVSSHGGILASQRNKLKHNKPLILFAKVRTINKGII
jgi:hypothetical protein